jgi:hypothetical protein
MSSVKLSVSNQARWGQKLITAYGEYDIAKDGIVEVPSELAEKLLGIPNSYEKVAVEKPKEKAKPAPKKGDLNKDGEVDQKDLDIAKEEQAEAKKEAEKADLQASAVMIDMTKKQLQDVAKEMKLPKGEWQKLNKSDLIDYIAKNS